MVLNGENIDITYTGTTPLTLTYQGQTYYYVTNIQGDVVGLTDANGTPLISYYYEVYGTGTYYRHNIEKADLLVRINPLCYRGYVYDRGTGGLMYLQSRYYDPAIGRFLIYGRLSRADINEDEHRIALYTMIEGAFAWELKSFIVAYLPAFVWFFS